MLLSLQYPGYHLKVFQAAIGAGTNEYLLDLGALEPMVARPHAVDNSSPVSQLKGTKIQQVFIGTCTNGRLEDLEVVARILTVSYTHLTLPTKA